MGNASSKPALDFDFYQFECKNKLENQPDLSYVGSTHNWDVRMRNHKSKCNNQKDRDHNLKIYKMIREFGGWKNWRVIKIDHIKNITKTEAKIHEQSLMDKYASGMNSHRATVSKEKHQLQIKEWKDSHPEYWTTRNKKIDCEICGGNYTLQNKSQHFKTDKHKKAILQNPKIGIF